MRALIVGLGNVGRRHLANLRRLEPKAHVTAWRRQSGAGGRDTGDAGADEVVYSIEDALRSKPDCAVIANPSSQHVATASALAREGIPLLIEKPLSDGLPGIDELLAACESRGIALMVGYNFRHYRPLQSAKRALDEGRIGRLMSLRVEVGQYLPDWAPGLDYRKSSSASRALGGGALLELSHELDTSRWLLGEVTQVSAQLARLSDLDIDVEDTAEITLVFQSGAIGSVHLDMTRRPMARSCRVIGTEGTLTWDWQDHRTRLYSPKEGRWEDVAPAAQQERNEMYLSEMGHFLACVRGERKPFADGRDAKRVLEIVLAAKRSAAEQRTIRI